MINVYCAVKPIDNKAEGIFDSNPLVNLLFDFIELFVVDFILLQ